MSIKNSSGTIGDRTRDLPTCSAVPQPTAPPRNLDSMFMIFSGLKFSHEEKELWLLVNRSLEKNTWVR
jgi:hypothetical protein